MLTSQNTLYRSRIIQHPKKHSTISRRVFITTIFLCLTLFAYSLFAINNYYIRKYQNIETRLEQLERLNAERNLKTAINVVYDTKDLLFDTVKKISEEKKREEKILKEKNDKIENHLKERNFIFKNTKFKGYDLPYKYYGNISTAYKPYMDYKAITAYGSPTWKINNNGNAYTDNLGLRRYRVSDNEFKLNGQDDYLVAMGTYYKPKHILNMRFLIVTTGGMFTVRTGDEKADQHTDDMHMFSNHGGRAGVIEFIVQTRALERNIRLHGDVAKSSNPNLNGEITHIYRID